MVSRHPISFLIAAFTLSSHFALAAPRPTVPEIVLEKSWVLKSDGLTQGEERAILTIGSHLSDNEYKVSVGDALSVTATRTMSGPLRVELPIQDLGPGDYTVNVKSKPSSSIVATTTLHVSYPLYVVVSTDWDDTRTDNTVLNWMEDLHQRFPKLRITQFFAPYHYTDPEITEARRQEIDTFIKRQRNVYGDELGVHIHGWCHFVNTTGVNCKTKETFGTDDGTGYTTILAAYSEEEMTKILQTSIEVYAKHGLGRPTSFRAGGWTASDTVFRALINTGFNADSSAVPAHRLISWLGYPLYDWNMARWAGITETSQPYYPFPSLLEVPDNGVLVDYISAKDMIQVYDQNQPEGKPLNRSTVYQIGFHPVDSFTHDRFVRMQKAIDHVEQHAYYRDMGPAVYVTLGELTQVFRN